MQSNLTRGLVAVLAVVLVVILFFVFSGDDETGVDGAPPATTAEEAGAPASTTTAQPAPETITITDGQPEGGVAELTYDKGDEVSFVVDSDTADEVHVHGYELMQDVDAGGRVEFDFPADIDGIFEVELEGAKTQIAELTVNP